MKHFLYPILLVTLIINLNGCAQSLYLTNPSERHNVKNEIIGLPRNIILIDDDEDSNVISDYPEKIQEPKTENSLSEIEKSMEDPENGEDLKRMEQNNSQVILDTALEHCENAHKLREQGKLDGALKELDQAYFLIADVNTDLLPNLMQQKEDIRFMISKRILEIYAAQGSVVTGKYKAIPITLNPYTQREIDSFTTGRERKFFLESYKRSGQYRKQIVEELKAAGLPVELSWLPLIESGFKTRALSKARALGLWQFIPSTGYKFGLERDTFIDERLDPEKATKAAILYLKELHQLFGDWATVLAAYNCGEERVLRIIRGQNVNYLDNFWDLYEKLPSETARYVPRFLACLHIINHPEQYGLEKIIVDTPMEYESVMIRKQLHLKDAAKAMELPEQVIADLNPELRYKILPENEYLLRVPLNSASLLLARVEKIPVSIPISSLVQKELLDHRVKQGDSLWGIARKYGTSILAIRQINHLSHNRLCAGQILKIPNQSQKQLVNFNEIRMNSATVL
jgi:membrane-bound lytic murein transglycosylase D